MYEIGTETLILCWSHSCIVTNYNIVDLCTENLPCNSRIENLCICQVSVHMFEVILNQTHFPSTLESSIKSKYVLIRGVHCSKNWKIRWNTNFMLWITINNLCDIGVCNAVLTCSYRISIIIEISNFTLSIKQLEYFTKNCWCITSVDFLDNKNIFFIWITICIC